MRQLMVYPHLTVEETEAQGKVAYPDLVDVEWLNWDSNPDDLAVPWGSRPISLGSRSFIKRHRHAYIHTCN